MYVLGVDIGTTGAKAILADERGRVLKKAYKGYGLIKPGPAMVEQRAEDWWDALAATVRECTDVLADKQGIAALSLSTQGQSMVPVDSCGKPLMNAISWMDMRGERQLEALLQCHSQEFYYRKSGWKLIAGGNLIQINWLKENNKEIFNSTFKFLSTLDYLNYKLTGRYVIDTTNAGITQLADIERGGWDEQLLAAADIGENRLAEVEEPGKTIGRLTAAAAEELGLAGSVQVVNGAHDQYCAALGAGLFKKGDLLLATGTAWVVTGIRDTPLYDMASYIAPGRHIVNGLWGALASIPTGGVSLEWYRDQIALQIRQGERREPESLSRIDQHILESGKRAEGLFFYPYFSGSGFPDWKGGVRAGLLGLGLEHDRYDLALAVMEGLAFEANIALEYFKDTGCSGERVKMLGGAAKSGLWSEIVAAVCGMPVVIMKESDAACIGAAIVAGVGCGMFDGYGDGYEKLGREERCIEADSGRIEAYRDKFSRYRKGKRLLEAF